jgi:predicted esterase
MKTHKIKIQTTANVCTYGDPKKAKHIFLALHGYGQLSQFFIRKFQLLSDDYFVVVPEGLHRFYLEGTSGRVGASWMTKEKRENDIHDYVNYLNEVYNNFSSTYHFESRILLGFSQGGSTASRWQKMGNFNATCFILWSAVFPSDLEQSWEVNFEKSQNYFVVGDEDPYYDPKKIATQTQYFIEKSVNFTTLVFKGNHNIDPSTLLKLCP